MSTYQMPERYVVIWEIDSNAETPFEAAREAWSALREKDSIANCFTVVDRNGLATKVDLWGITNDTYTEEDEVTDARLLARALAMFASRGDAKKVRYFITKGADVSLAMLLCHGRHESMEGFMLIDKTFWQMQAEGTLPEQLKLKANKKPG